MVDGKEPEQPDDDHASRRTAPRAPVVLQLEYRNAGHLLVSYCTNLSRGGLFIPTDDPLPAGSALTLRMDVPGKAAPAELTAEVRWVRSFDTDEGPAGMGLAFSGIDKILGKQIDGIVARFAPLRIELVGDRPQVWTHVAALVRALLTCTIGERGIDLDAMEGLDTADLVIVDVDSSNTNGLQLLTALSEFDRPPPRVSLCNAQDLSMAGRAARHSRVVRLPVDGHELRSAVLECVSRVYAHATDGPSPDESLMIPIDEDDADDEEDGAPGAGLLDDTDVL